MNGNSPVEVLTNQILKYQFPSSFSIGREYKYQRGLGLDRLDFY